MTTFEPEQKDILEKLNEIAFEANWGGKDRVYAAEAPNDMPKTIAVIQEAMEEIKRLRELPKEILQNIYNHAKHGTKDDDNGFALACYRLRAKIIAGANKYGITLDVNNS